MICNAASYSDLEWEAAFFDVHAIRPEISVDAGYDSEANHRFAREQCQVRSIIPHTRGRPTSKPAAGHYRRLMQTRFDVNAYHDRPQVETVISMIKRRQGAHVRGTSYWSQCRDLRLKVLTHNVMILLHIKVFKRAVLTCSVENLPVV